MCGVSFENAWPKTSGLAAFSAAVPCGLTGTMGGNGFESRGTREGEKSSGFVSTL